ncbi:MAG: lipopolysaccharide biosynthesis protein, partial [Desulfatibacillaceae bacterium]
MADDFADKFRRLIHLAGVYSFGTIVEKFFGFVLIPVYTYYLSPDDFGIIGLMTLVTLLAYQVLGSPINTGFMRFYYNPDFREIRKEFAFVTMMCTLAACTLAAIVLFSLSSVAAAFFLESENLAPIVRVYAGILLFRAVFDLGANMLKMEERARHFVLANWIVFLVSSTVTLVGLIVMHMGVMALILGQFAGLAAGSAMVLPFYISQSRPTRAVGMLREPLKFGYPYLLLGVSNQLLQMGDRYLLKVFTSLTEVGLYSFGYRIADLIMILLVSPLAKALQPLFLKLEDDPETLREFVKKTCTYYYVFGSFICLGLAVFSREFVQLIAQKESFHASWPVIPVIAYSHLHYGLGYFLGWGIVMSKQSVYM